MTDLSFRCPRCKQHFHGADAEDLADEVMAHLESAHRHAPPRVHVVARIERHGTPSG